MAKQNGRKPKQTLNQTPLEPDKTVEYRVAIDQLRDLFEQSYRNGDFKTCIAARKDLSELLDLYPAKTVKNEHSGPGGKPIEIKRVLDDEELRIRLAEFLDAARERRTLSASDISAAPTNGHVLRGGNDAGSLAEKGTPFESSEDLAPLFPSKR